MRVNHEDALAALTPSFGTALRAMLGRLRRRASHMLCLAIHGGHELYRARAKDRLYQQCLLCGYETKGWAIDVNAKSRPIRPSHAVTQPRRRPRAVA